MNYIVLQNHPFDDLLEELYETEKSIQYKIYKTTSRTLEANPTFKNNCETEMLIYTEKEGCFELPVVKRICERLIFVPNTASFIKLLPGVIMPPHRDNVDTRCSHFIIPIFPLNNNYTTTMFYDNKKNVIDRCQFSTGPVIINTQELHSVQNNKYERIQFNLGFSESIYDWNNKIYR